MSDLTEHELSVALRQAVSEPPPLPQRARLVRRRAHQIRRRRLALAATPLAGAVGAVTVPTLVHDVPGDSAVPATGSPSDVGSAGIPAELHRPLMLPAIAAGDPCPVSSVRRLPPSGGFSSAFAAVGPGPVYLAGRGRVFVDGRSGESKVIWVIEPNYTGGRVLIRGGQIDGSHGLRFERYIGAVGYSGSGPGDGKGYRTLAYPGTDGFSPDARTYPSVIRLRAPGCYALQVDGVGFSESIVFRAAVPRRPGGAGMPTLGPPPA